MEETLTTWRELDEAIGAPDWAQHPDHARSTLVFRGLSRAVYTNESGLARLGGDFPTVERHLIRNFRKYAHQAAPGPTIWDWLALGQHHGLPTRLLDWTFSPYVALHFATVAWPDDDAVLWAVDCAAVHERLPEVLRSALREEGALVFTTEQMAAHAPDVADLARLEEGAPFLAFMEPPSLDDRIVNQAAVLSTCSDPTCSLQDWLADHPGLWRAWRIPAELKAEVRGRLDQAAISERVLMPGLDGLAAWLRRYYSSSAIARVDEQQGAAMDGSDRDVDHMR